MGAIPHVGKSTEKLLKDLERPRIGLRFPDHYNDELLVARVAFFSIFSRWVWKIIKNRFAEGKVLF